ncbi:MAG: hypothetical protein JWO05_1244 [Gemmatimonadetes bacterium]|nr:hypothetical protein [Gemmatimonadota bacterium]
MTGARRGDVIVHVFGRTDVGRTREHNEDAFVVADLTADNASLQPQVRTHTSGERGTLFMVADGMGGAAAGEIASAMATEIVLRELRDQWMKVATPGDDEFAGAIKRAAVAANREIHAYAANHPEYRGMGTTATIAGLLSDSLYLAQVGDSRAYLVRDGVARQITKDQSLMQKLIEAGELTEEEAEHSERRNIILQALGPEQSIKVDLTHQRVRRNDVLVLCSDGLSGQVSRDEISQVIREEADLVSACKRLIDKANERGGPDNITVIAARFDGEGLESVSQADEVGHRVFALADSGQSPAVERPRETGGGRPTVPVGAAVAAAVPDAITLEVPPAQRPSAPVAPKVTDARRGRGMTWATLLFVALVIAAGWFIFRTARKVTPLPSTTSPAAGSPRS